jgi:hypothetical protein
MTIPSPRPDSQEVQQNFLIHFDHAKACLCDCRDGFTERDHSRMQDLAEKSQAGTLTGDEAREFDSYLHIGNLLSAMQSKARLLCVVLELPKHVRECSFSPASLVAGWRALSTAIFLQR